ncbi:MAG TPA: sulfotransferase domain-containing protein [Gammaproteobacteria bacterium]|nr:sulfotransferase domain-containing protein [Gammaproteobacteria bacterium]
MKTLINFARSRARALLPKSYRAKRQAARRLKAFREMLRPDDTFLVGHPKSGNTWLAYMLAIAAGKAPADGITLANIGTHIPTIHAQDFRISEFADLAAPRAFRNEGPVFPNEYPRTIYLMRDPRAAWVSYYHHCVHDTEESDWSLDDFVDEMIEHGCIRRLEPHLIRWDIQVADWMNRTASQPVHFVKYEELIADRATVLRRVLEFIGVDADPELLALVDERGAFKSMRRQEETHGAESYPGEKGARGYFVRKGRVDGWRDELTPRSAERIRHALGGVMARAGYVAD